MSDFDMMPIRVPFTNDDIGNSTAKITGVHPGVLGETSITDDYYYICVQGGTEQTAIWKKIVLFKST